MTKRQDDWSAQSREEGFKEGFQQGFQQGLQQGLQQRLQQRLQRVRKLVSRLAARKFGEPVGERLAPLMDQIQEPDRMIEIGEWVIDCDSAEDLLIRTQQSVASV